MTLAYQQLISDFLVLASVVAAVLSVILAIVALSRTRAPRGGAIALVLAIVLVAVGAFSSTQPVTPQFVADAWHRVTSPKKTPGPAPIIPPETVDADSPSTDEADMAPTQ